MYTKPLEDLPVFKTTGAPLAQQVLDFITTEVAPVGGLEMSYWGVKTECGTAGCFAGWTMLLTGTAHWRPAYPDTVLRHEGATAELDGHALYKYADEDGHALYKYAEVIAGELLGLDGRDRNFMFLWNRGPAQVLPELWRKAKIVWGDDITVPESVRKSAFWNEPPARVFPTSGLDL